MTPQPPAAGDTSLAATGWREGPGQQRGGKKEEEETGGGERMFLTISKCAPGSEMGKCRLGAGRAGSGVRHPRVPEQLPSASLREDGTTLTPKQSAAHSGDTGDAALLPGASTWRLLGCTVAGHSASRAGSGHPIPTGCPGDGGSRLGGGSMTVPLTGGAVGGLMVLWCSMHHTAASPGLACGWAKQDGNHEAAGLGPLPGAPGAGSKRIPQAVHAGAGTSDG